MGSLTIKLAFAGLRSRRAESALSVLVVAAATSALTVGLAIHTVADRPFERTFAAINGAHVTAESGGGEAALEEVERLPGVVESSGVLPVAWTAFDRDGKRYGLRLVGLGDEPPKVPTPLLVDGELAGPGEVALERSFAEFHDLEPGSTLQTLGGPLRVSGIVVVALGNAYPQTQPGLGLAPAQTLEAVVPDRDDWTHVVGVRIAEPEQTGAFAARVDDILAGQGSSGSRPLGSRRTWLDDRGEATAATSFVSVIVSIFGTLLLFATGAVLATLVGGRVVAQAREIGTLKAAGLTPGQVARVLVVEQLGLAVLGVVVGVVAGWLLTPVFTYSDRVAPERIGDAFLRPAERAARRRDRARRGRRVHPRPRAPRGAPDDRSAHRCDGWTPSPVPDRPPQPTVSGCPSPRGSAFAAPSHDADGRS